MGLMKLHALRSHPRYIINRRKFLRLISPTSKKEKYEKRNETATLESKFPLLSVEHGCIVSKDADITVAYKVELPELFTLTKAEYEAVHSTWAKAVKVLPNYSIVHKQDFFIEESYRPDICKDDLSFSAAVSSGISTNVRIFLQHTCYLFLTKTTKERSRTTSSFNALTRNFIIPKEMTDRETVTRFMESCEQFERIVNDSGLLRMTRLTDEEITERTPLRESSRNTSRSQEDTACLQDLSLGAGEMKIGDNYLCLHTLSDPEDLPSNVATDCRYERLSTDRSDCRLLLPRR